MSQTRYEVVLSPRAKSAIERDLPGPSAFAVVAFLYDPLAEGSRSGGHDQALLPQLLIPRVLASVILRPARSTGSARLLGDGHDPRREACAFFLGWPRWTT